jgi:hypothetical protein
VFHQKRKGIKTMSQAVRKIRKRLRTDILWCGEEDGWVEESTAVVSGEEPVAGEDGGLAMSSLRL